MPVNAPFSRRGIVAKSAFAIILFACSTALWARPAELLRDDIRTKLRRSAATGEKVIVRGFALGGEATQAIELEPMRVWAVDGRIAVHKADGNVEYLAPPDIRSFKGSIVGAEDSAVYVSMTPGGRIEGIALLGERRFGIHTGIAMRKRLPVKVLDDIDFAGAPVFVREDDFVDDLLAGNNIEPWQCDLEKLPQRGNINIPVTEDQRRKLRQIGNAGSVAGATYSMRLQIETDTELYAAFGSVGALSTYLTNLVGTASVVYQRDLNTTLMIGDSNIYSGGSDPWTTDASAGTSALLAELGTYYHNNAIANYGLEQRSTVVWVSGRLTNGGVAWVDVLCQADFYCGDTGAGCGSPTFAMKWGGGYAFCGSLTGTNGVTTTVPDPTLTQNGVEFGLPEAFSANNNFWMLIQFMHELGHNVSSQHTHCVTLTPAEKTLYGVTRDYVDECENSEGGCFGGTEAAPTELGTIMSYCHNKLVGATAFRASRYRFWKAGEPSEKMFTILKTGDPAEFTTGLEGATPNPTITAGGGTIPCTAGQTASVASCTGCTYAWQITGGSITSATTGTSITYTPTAPSTILTVTITKNGACGITASRTLTTACAALAAPTNVVAAATTSTNVQVTWAAASGAASYNVYRTPNNGTSFSLIMGGVVGTTHNDSTATAGSAYLYKVRSFNSVESGDSNVDLATTVIFTDPTLTPASTLVQAAHFTQMRTAVNAVQTLASQTNTPYTDVTLDSTVSVKGVHSTELRTRLNAARAVITGLSPATFTNTIIAGTTVITALDMNELRAGVQ